jgi:hypothetical protein
MRKLVMLCSLCGEQSDVDKDAPRGTETQYRTFVDWNKEGDLARRVILDLSVTLTPQNMPYSEGQLYGMPNADICASCRAAVQRKAFRQLISERLSEVPQ